LPGAGMVGIKDVNVACGGHFFTIALHLKKATFFLYLQNIFGTSKLFSDLKNTP